MHYGPRPPDRSSIIGEIRRCSEPECRRLILWAVTAAGKLMPLEHHVANIPDGMPLNVAYHRASSGRVTARILKKGETKEPEESLTVPHFATCEPAIARRKAAAETRAAAGAAANVVAFPTAIERARRRRR